MDEKFTGDEIFTLTDEEGNESEFELLGSREVNGVLYLALAPTTDNDEGEYVILKMASSESGEDEMLVTIDDDDEFDMIADIFDNELFDTAE
ncbi:MAG: DUF1292 domain-containing protein [Oscillospiraceae bacterium]|nr:DUF1292 domain-containing protein [Oscillospiraceae bacterium]